jgi:hypothetical protein
MKQVLQRRPRAAMIVAIIALVVAMAGSAVAGSSFLPSKKFKKFKSNAVTRLTYVNNTVTVPTSNTDFTTVSASCPTGFHPVGGGVKLTPPDGSFWWDDGYLTATGYAAKINNSSGTARTALITVACVAARATGAPSG